jgi:hypothetical protein
MTFSAFFDTNNLFLSGFTPLDHQGEDSVIKGGNPLFKMAQAEGEIFFSPLP